MDEAKRIMDNSASMPAYHGTTTSEVVDQILDSCGGQIFCRGSLREFVFTPVGRNHFKFHTVDWYSSVFKEG